MVAHREHHADRAKSNQRQRGEAIGRRQLGDSRERIRLQAAARRGRHDLGRAARQRVRGGREAELQEHEHDDRRDRPRQRARVGARGASPDRLDEGERRRGGDPDPRFGGGRARERREHCGERHPSAHGGESRSHQQRREQRLDHRGARREQEDRIEDQERDGDPGLPGVRREGVDAGGGRQSEHRAQPLQETQLPQPEDAQHRRREELVGRQPRVLHAEERIVQLAGRGEVGGHQPVAVAVLERLRHLGGGKEKDPGQREQRRERSRRPHPRERAEAEPAERQHLEQVREAQGGNGQKAGREETGVHRQKALVHDDGQGKNGQGAEPERRFEDRAWVANPDVCLVAPLLPASHDVVLRRPHEGAPGP